MIVLAGMFVVLCLVTLVFRLRGLTGASKTYDTAALREFRARFKGGQ